MEGKIFYTINTPPLSVTGGRKGVNSMTDFTFDLQRFADYQLRQENGSFYLGETSYPTISKVCSALQNSDTVKLTSDIDIGSGNLQISGKTLTFDLNGHTLKRTSGTSGAYIFYLYNGANITVTDSSNEKTGSIVADQSWITANSSTRLYAVKVGTTATFTLENGNITMPGNTNFAVGLQSEATFEMKDGTLTAKDGTGVGILKGDTVQKKTYGGSTFNLTDGKIDANVGVTTGEQATFTMTGGEITSTSFGINDSSAGNTGTTKTEISGGKITSSNATAVNHTKTGTLTVSGGVLTGKDSGVEIEAGTLTVSDNADISGEKSLIVENLSSGTAVTVNITGGQLKSTDTTNNVVIYAENTNSNAKISVTGGSFNGNVIKGSSTYTSNNASGLTEKFSAVIDEQMSYYDSNDARNSAISTKTAVTIDGATTRY